MKALLITAVCLLLGLLIFPTAIQPAVRETPEEKQVSERAEKIAKAMEDYRAKLGHPPKGENSEVVAALRGRNPKDLVLLKIEDEALNERGEIVDPWRTPFLLSFDPKTKRARVESAGPNRRFDGAGSRSDDYSSGRRGGIPGLPF